MLEKTKINEKGPGLAHLKKYVSNNLLEHVPVKRQQSVSMQTKSYLRWPRCFKPSPTISTTSWGRNTWTTLTRLLLRTENLSSGKASLTKLEKILLKRLSKWVFSKIRSSITVISTLCEFFHFFFSPIYRRIDDFSHFCHLLVLR